MQKNHFLLLNKLKNTESAQLCKTGQYGWWSSTDNLSIGSSLVLYRLISTVPTIWAPM